MTAPLILSVGADGRFAGMVVPELIRRGARVRGLIHQAENADTRRLIRDHDIVNDAVHACELLGVLHRFTRADT